MTGEMMRLGMFVQNFLATKAAEVEYLLFGGDENSDSDEETGEAIRTILYSIMSEIKGSYYHSGNDGLDAQLAHLVAKATRETV